MGVKGTVVYSITAVGKQLSTMLSIVITRERTTVGARAADACFLVGLNGTK